MKFGRSPFGKYESDFNGVKKSKADQSQEHLHQISSQLAQRFQSKKINVFLKMVSQWPFWKMDPFYLNKSESTCCLDHYIEF